MATSVLRPKISQKTSLTGFPRTAAQSHPLIGHLLRAEPRGSSQRPRLPGPRQAGSGRRRVMTGGRSDQISRRQRSRRPRRPCHLVPRWRLAVLPPGRGRRSRRHLSPCSALLSLRESFSAVRGGPKGIQPHRLTKQLQSRPRQPVGLEIVCQLLPRCILTCRALAEPQ